MGELITAFGLGNTAILNNVCLLPLYPGLMAFLAGNAGTNNTKLHMGLLGAIVLAGVLTMMTFVALLLYLFNAVTDDILPVLLPLIYGIVFLLGIAMLVGYNPWAKMQQLQAPVFKNPNATAYMYGLLLGPMTLPCIAPLIITAFALGSDDAAELLDGIAYFLAFGLGFGWPLVALPLVAGTTQRRFIGWMTKNHDLLTRFSGVLLVGIAILGFVTEVLPTLDDETTISENERWAVSAALEDHSEPIAALAFTETALFSAGGVGNSGLFTDGTDFAARQWNLEDSTISATLDTLTNRTETLAVQSNLLAIGGWDNTLQLVAADTLGSITTRNAHTARIIALSFAPDGTRLASGSEDGTIHVWTVDGETLISTDPVLTLNHPRLSDVVLSNDAIFSASIDNTIQRWDAATGEQVATFAGHADWVLDIALSADTSQLASASADSTVRVWDVATAETVATLQIAGVSGEIVAVDFSTDGRFLAAGAAQQVVAWRTDALDRAPAITFREHNAPVTTLQFSDDSQFLASADRNGAVQLYETP
jgi:cytochrome c-type biogenesis protein